MTNKREAVDNKEDMACNIESLSNTKRDTKGTANPLVICFEKGICIIFQKMKKYLSVYYAWMKHIAAINLPLTGICISMLRLI